MITTIFLISEAKFIKTRFDGNKYLEPRMPYFRYKVPIKTQPQRDNCHIEKQNVLMN